MTNENKTTDAEVNLKESLIRFQNGIKAADGAAISAALNEIEALFAAHRGELHPRLVHFLEGRSYAKAMAWLGVDGDMSAKPSTPPGGCAGRS